MRATIDGKIADEIRSFGSIWGDLLHVRMVLDARTSLSDDAKDLFARRALWEAAVISYGRCFGTGRRNNVQLKDLVDQLDPSLRECHKRTLTWRNKHVAHRDSPAFERVDIEARINDRTDEVEAIEARVVTRVEPDEDTEAARLGQLATALADCVWANRIKPREMLLIADNQPRVDELKKRPAPVSTAGRLGSGELVIDIKP